MPYFAPTRAMLLSFFLSLPRPYLFLPFRFAHAQNHSSIFRSSRFLVNSRPRIISRIISVLVVVVLGYSRHSRWNPPRPNDDVTLVHGSPCPVLSVASYSRSCRTKSGRRAGQREEDEEDEEDEEAHWERAREQPSLTELLPLRSLHSREAVVYAPRHPTDAELMILINVS